VRGVQWGLGAVGQFEEVLGRVHRPRYCCPPWEVLPQWVQGSPIPQDSGPGPGWVPVGVRLGPDPG
jgi:hypothetical protein